MRTSAIAAVIAAGMLAGCGLLSERSALTDHQAKPTLLTDAQRWWKPLGDPMIDVLVDDLVAENIDMQMALTRIDEARGLRRSAASAFLPDISLGGQAQRGNRQTPELATISQGGFDALWEFDLFGHVRAAVDAADADIEQTQAAAEDVRNSMVAELVRTTIEWRQALETIRVTQSLVTAQSKQIDLIRSRTTAGLADSSELERALAQRAQTATQLPLARASAAASEMQMERLLAKGPDSLKHFLKFYEGEPPTLPTAEDALQLNLDQVRDRPDMRAARAALTGSNAALRQAERAVWPRITLGAFFGGQNSTPGALVGENPLWSVVANASMPLLNFGRIYGAIDAADARAKRAELAYRNTSLMALQETRTALSDYLYGLEATAKLQQSLEHRRTAVDLARERFRNGLTDMTDLTTAQGELDQANLALIARRAQTALAFVRLHKALGTATLAAPDTDAPNEQEPADEAAETPAAAPDANDPNDPGFVTP